MDRWADSSRRMTLLWPHTAACLSVTLSASFFSSVLEGWGEREIHLPIRLPENKCGGGEKPWSGSDWDPGQVGLFALPSQIHSQCPRESHGKTPVIIWPFFSSPANLTRLCQGSADTKANSTYSVAVAASRGGSRHVNLGCWDKQLALAFCLKMHSIGDPPASRGAACGWWPNLPSVTFSFTWKLSYSEPGTARNRWWLNFGFPLLFHMSWPRTDLFIRILTFGSRKEKSFQCVSFSPHPLSRFKIFL